MQSSQHPFTPKCVATGVSKGIAVGRALFFKNDVSISRSRTFESASKELARLKAALNQVEANLGALIEKTSKEVGAEEAHIFEAHLMMIQDEELIGPIKNQIESESCISETAIEKAFAFQIEVFSNSDSDYMKERALDLKDLKSQLLRALNPSTADEVTKIHSPVILIAEDLTPSQTLLLDRTKILGIITEKGGETSHSAIIARTLGIPAISGVSHAFEVLSDDEEIALDGKEGSVFVASSTESRQYFEQRAGEYRSASQGLQTFKGKPSVTHDQHPVSLMGNIGGSADAQTALDSDAEGIGLFRTEFLFMGRNSAPTLEEQRSAYRQVLSMMAPREVVIRSLDVGGDKPIDYIRISKEENPFLGVRAIRYCLQDLPLFKTQIKAMLLANEWGNLSIMTPMVSRATEAKDVLVVIEECHRELLTQPGYLAKPYRVGTMVEIPSLIFEMKELKSSVSFISVGTNDLMQYSFAVDRMNPELKHLYTPYHLGFLRMMKMIADEASKNGLNLGICGELGGQDDLIPLWVAMGYQKLSMNPNEVLTQRRLLSKLNLRGCQELMNRVFEARDGAEVKLVLSEFLKGIEGS